MPVSTSISVVVVLILPVRFISDPPRLDRNDRDTLRSAGSSCNAAPGWTSPIEGPVDTAVTANGLTGGGHFEGGLFFPGGAIDPTTILWTSPSGALVTGQTWSGLPTSSRYFQLDQVIYWARNNQGCATSPSDSSRNGARRPLTTGA